MSVTTQHCARCRRPTPDQLSAEFLEWEALGETGKEVICPGCLTLGEERAIGDDANETAKAAAGMSVDDLRAELLGGWAFLDDRHKLLLVAAAHRLAAEQKKAANA